MPRAKVTIKDLKTKKVYESMYAAGKDLAKLVKGDPNDRFVWFSIARAFPGRFVEVKPDGKEIHIENRVTGKKAEKAGGKKAETVLYEKRENIVIITLNRPDALNAINRELRRELAEAIGRFDGDPEAVVAIITGAGRAFCAGRDLKERASDNAAGIQARAAASMAPDRPYMWPQTWKPLIAAINGYALAGGWSIAQMCDLRVASADAKLGITETKWSLLPPFGTILPKMIPLAAVLELVFTAQPITAQRAYEIGFVNRVVPTDRLMPEAIALAEQIAENAPLAVQFFKEIAYRGLSLSTEATCALTYHLYDQLLGTEDSKEGPRAFAEKRRPRWQGR